jgi:cytochrome c oxidase assembly protein subunit 15
VLLAAIVWFRNKPSPKPLPQLGWIAFALVQFQGLLGGLRVVLFKDEIGIFHAMLAQLFFVLLCVIALFTSGWWQNRPMRGGIRNGARLWFRLLGVTTLLIFGQLVLAATMRHQHAGLAIPDFPLAYGKIWPAMDAQSLEWYNQHRIESMAVNPITSFQIGLQMAHRIVAGLIVIAVAVFAWRFRNEKPGYRISARLGFAWLALILSQAFLGAATIWSNKAADIATAHVVIGALSLAMGAIMTILASRSAVLAGRNAIPSGITGPLSPVPFADPLPAAPCLDRAMP